MQEKNQDLSKWSTPSPPSHQHVQVHSGCTTHWMAYRQKFTWSEWINTSAAWDSSDMRTALTPPTESIASQRKSLTTSISLISYSCHSTTYVLPGIWASQQICEITIIISVLRVRKLEPMSNEILKIIKRIHSRTRTEWPSSSLVFSLCLRNTSKERCLVSTQLRF